MIANRQSPKADASTGKVWLRLACACESTGGQYFGHYDVVRCSCGRFYWALQPRANGPLQVFPHPGFHPVAPPITTTGSNYSKNYAPKTT